MTKILRYKPLSDVPRPVAVPGDVVEDLPLLAAVAPGHLAVYADVEELTVFRVCVPGVLLGLLLPHLGTRELEHLCKTWEKSVIEENIHINL